MDRSAGKMVGSSALLHRQAFCGSSSALGRGNGSRLNAFFKGGTKQLKKATAPAKKAIATPIKKAVPKTSVGTQRVGKRKGSGGGDALWLPNTERPAWLDGSLPGDRGFDPLKLSAPTEFLQVGIDQLDQNKAVNKAGAIVGKFAAPKSKISDTALQPYDEVFGLQRFRETELIHGRSVNFELMMDRCILLLSCTVKRQY
ncbi:hypothetical protein WJX75_003991 [Coccomyxa subellipsoidea]|uniref:Chlorophyll a-b binding protein, chloroplastic n=1 Tax=Coccomyxa subellipsoidea TaxID=248742 RepID=A0ABR2YMA0_9CHLO